MRAFSIAVLFLGLTIGRNTQTHACFEQVTVLLKVHLHGPYDSQTGLMRDDLRTNGLIPLEEPYAAMGYEYVGGLGSFLSFPNIFNIQGPTAIVDWVIVELRDPTDPAKVVSSRAGLLQRNGFIRDVDFDHGIQLCAPAGRYFVAVRHRNHLGIMAARPVELVNYFFSEAEAEASFIDLTSPDLVTYRNDEARKQVDDVMVLWAGDVNFDGRIIYTGEGNDRDIVLGTIGGVVPTATVQGYSQADVDLSGEVKYTGERNDRDPILQSIGGVVPTQTRIGYLPMDTVIVRDRVHVVDSTMWILDLELSDPHGSGQLVYTVLENMPELQVNDVLVGSTGFGYLRKVLSFDIDLDQLTVQTATADIADVFQQATLVLNPDILLNGEGLVVDVDDDEEEELGQLATFSEGTAMQRDLPGNFTVVLVDQPSVKVKLKNIGFDLQNTPNIEKDITPSGASTTIYSWRVQQQFTSTLDIQLSLALDSAKRSVPLSPPLRTVFWVGTVPVVVVTQLFLVGKYGANASLNSTVGIQQTSTTILGVEETEGNWSPLLQPPQIDVGIVPGTSNLNASVGAEFDCYFELRIALYEAVGPVFKSGIGMGFNYSVGASAPPLDRDLAANVSWKNGVEVQLLPFSNSSVTIGQWDAPPFDFLNWRSPGRMAKGPASGDQQSGLENTVLDLPLETIVYPSKVLFGNSLDQPPPDNAGTFLHPLRWEVVSGGGRVIQDGQGSQTGSTLTDFDGFARLNWELGTRAEGPQRLKVWAQNGTGDTLVGGPLIYEASILPDKLVKWSGDGQVGTPEQPLTEPIEVRVEDASGAVLEGVPVAFEVIGGGGTIDNNVVVTDILGLAQVEWTLGTWQQGQQRLQVTAVMEDEEQMENSPLEFTALLPMDSLLYMSGNDQFGQPNAPLAEPLVVRVVDESGVAKEGVLVAFEVIEGGGSVDPSVQVTELLGFAETTWTLGAEGPQRVRVTALGESGEPMYGSPMEFVALFDCPSTVTDIDGNVYPVVRIGDQCWMAKNLATTRLRDGTTLPLLNGGGHPSAPDSPVLYQGAARRYPETASGPSASLVPEYGMLYNGWSAYSDLLCPQGWKMPSDDDWIEMELHLGMPPSVVYQCCGRGGGVASKLKSQTWDGTNASGFSALPAGFNYVPISFFAAFWTSTPTFLPPDPIYGPSQMSRWLETDWFGVDRYEVPTGEYYSCRCIRQE